MYESSTEQTEVLQIQFLKAQVLHLHFRNVYKAKVKRKNGIFTVVTEVTALSCGGMFVLFKLVMFFLTATQNKA